jgi:hypothetical protein
VIEKEYIMRKIEAFWVTFVIISIFSAWWFLGREPYIVLSDGYSQPGLVYVEPKWNGWDTSALTFKKEVPPEFREGYPYAEGWWYVKRQIAEIPENYIKIDEPIEKSIEKLEKYFAWKPLGIIK